MTHFFTLVTLFSWATSTVKCEAFSKSIYTDFQHKTFFCREWRKVTDGNGEKRSRKNEENFPKRQRECHVILFGFTVVAEKEEKCSENLFDRRANCHKFLSIFHRTWNFPPPSSHHKNSPRFAIRCLSMLSSETSINGELSIKLSSHYWRFVYIDEFI